MRFLFILSWSIVLPPGTLLAQVELTPLPIDKIDYDSLHKVIQKEEATKNYRRLGLLYGGIYNYYLYSSFKDSAIIYADKAQENAFRAADSTTYYFIQLQLAEFYTNALDFKLAQDHYEKALRYYLTTKNYIRQGSAYGGLSYMYELKKDSLRMLLYLDSMEQANLVSHDTTYIVSAKHSRSLLLRQKGNLDSAIKLLQNNLLMIDRATRFGNGEHIRNFWRELEIGLLAEIYYQKRDYASAIKILRQAQGFGKHQSDFNDQMVFRQRVLIKSFINLDRKDSAKKYIDIFFDGAKKAVTNISPERITEITARYESEKKQRQISELERKNLLHQLAVADQRKLNLIIVIIFLIILAGVFLYINTVRHKRKIALDLAKQEMKYQQHLHKKNELEMRNRITRDLHDDVGATLSTIKAYSEIIESTPDQVTISGLIRENAAEMIERLEVIAWATNPDNDRFKSLTDTMVKFAIPVMHARNIAFHFEKDGISDDLIVPGDIRQNIFLIFKEGINNIVKHASATKCKVALSVDQNTFRMSLADDGVGISDAEASAKSHRSGLKNMYQRAQDLQGELQVVGKISAGTIVSLLVPYPFQRHRS